MSKGPKNPWSKKGVQPVTGMGVAGSVIRIEGGLLDLKCRDTVERMIKAGQLTSIKIGKRRMVVAQSVRDLIARQLAEQSTQKT